jgi:hypothetical protein
MTGAAAGWFRAETAAGRVALDPELGNLRELAFAQAGGSWLAPLHSAPWAGTPEAEAMPDLLPLERRLAGDFLCAPFGANDVEGGPFHGWTANSPWRLLDRGPGRLWLELGRPVMGARIEKRLTLAADAPLLYQEHLIDGGAGTLTAAHHPMVRLAGAGRLCLSPKRCAISPDADLEPGRSLLACPARTADPRAFPAAAGGTLDLTRLPLGARHEDFVTLVEAAGNPLGWAALLREAEDDIVFFLKSPDVLPVTMLWYSNGGRDFAPWSGRHLGVLGIEDGRCAGALGHAAAAGPNPVAAEGVPTVFALKPGRVHRIAHVTGALPRPPGWGAVADIAVSGNRLMLTGDTGARITLPFRDGFLDAEG